MAKSKTTIDDYKDRWTAPFGVSNLKMPKQPTASKAPSTGAGAKTKKTAAKKK